MKASILIVILSLSIACSSEPEPLRYGKDSCYACKMTLMDKKFGAEIVTRKGKVYKFDDLNCMAGFYNSNFEESEDIEHLLVIDFAKPESLIDARQAFFVKTTEIRTPMASGIAAFSGEDVCVEHNAKWNGTLLKWTEVLAQFK